MVAQLESAAAEIAQRRQWTRLTVAVPMFVRGTDPQGKRFVEFATALNISAGGALLVLHRGLQEGTEVSLEIPIGLLPQSLVPRMVRQMEARLLRSQPTERVFLAAVQFANPLPV